MAAKKIYVASIHNGRVTIYHDTMEVMTNGIFGYTLECGNSWNNKIPRYPKTIKSLIKALNASAEECRRYSDYYREATAAEIQYFEDNHSEDNHSVTIWNK